MLSGSTLTAISSNPGPIEPDRLRADVDKAVVQTKAHVLSEHPLEPTTDGPPSFAHWLFDSVIGALIAPAR